MSAASNEGETSSEDSGNRWHMVMVVRVEIASSWRGRRQEECCGRCVSQATSLD